MTTLHVVINAVNDNAAPRGPDRYLLELIPALLRADPNLILTVVAAPWQAELIKEIRGHDVAVHMVRPPRSPALRLIWQASRFPSIARALNPDLVFLPNLIWAPNSGAPVVLTAHDLLHFRVPEKFGRIKTALLKPVIRRALRTADHVIAVSGFTAEDCLQFGDVAAHRLSIVTEGGPTAHPRTAAPPERVFLFVGKVERTKGLSSLIDAFVQSDVLKDLGYRLKIVGPRGNASDSVETAISRSDAAIDLLGFVEDATLQSLYHRCRGFVFPSIAEGFGLVLLEAMARGAPVITTQATSLPEVAGDAALLVAPRDTDALTRAMEALAIDDSLFLDLQSRGYARLDAFSWDRAGQDTARIFRQMAQTTGDEA